MWTREGSYKNYFQTLSKLSIDYAQQEKVEEQEGQKEHIPVLTSKQLQKKIEVRLLVGHVNECFRSFIRLSCVINMNYASLCTFSVLSCAII